MGIPNSSTSTQYRPSCRDIRSNCSKAPRRRRLRRPDLELRRRDTTDRLSPQGSSTGRALVVGPYLRRRAVSSVASRMEEGVRAPTARLEEAAGLARAIDLDVVEAGLVTLGEIRPATYLGKGNVEEFARLLKSPNAATPPMH